MDDRVSEVIRAVTKRNTSALLRGMAEVTQKRVADLIGVSEATLSDIKTDRLERFAALAAACGLKLVPVTERSLEDKHINALEVLAAMALRSGLSDRGRDDE